ncbi:trna dimethylallyltransferase [Cystoisospora suis]|uniref:Trna dimethylallyltransferase n=1 Tax=Cystoisospora suis TaxID=483139 RepID=A0A2C6LAA3_9APIC|nr:trna dimethylallyltransferase [Cystoisospora suis]
MPRLAHTFFRHRLVPRTTTFPSCRPGAFLSHVTLLTSLVFFQICLRSIGTTSHEGSQAWPEPSTGCYFSCELRPYPSSTILTFSVRQLLRQLRNSSHSFCLLSEKCCTSFVRAPYLLPSCSTGPGRRSSVAGRSLSDGQGAPRACLSCFSKPSTKFRKNARSVVASERRLRHSRGTERQPPQSFYSFFGHTLYSAREAETAVKSRRLPLDRGSGSISSSCRASHAFARVRRTKEGRSTRCSGCGRSGRLYGDVSFRSTTSRICYGPAREVVTQLKECSPSFGLGNRLIQVNTPPGIYRCSAHFGAQAPPLPLMKSCDSSVSASLSNGVVYVLGPTGVGKTKLSIELALSLEKHGTLAEIISADSMQVYRGCDVATAKATPQEQQAVRHHLIDICDVTESFSVLKFLRLATQTISALHSRGVVPIVVGGTQLYMQHLLWTSVLDDLPPEAEDASEGTMSLDSAWQALPTDKLFEHLQRLDPERAAQLHAHDRRRIIRSIEATATSGVPHSKLMRDRREISVREGLRYPSCILWLDCRNDQIHCQRLELRVAQMLQASRDIQGLLQECEWLLDTLKITEFPAQERHLRERFIVADGDLPIVADDSDISQCDGGRIDAPSRLCSPSPVQSPFSEEAPDGECAVGSPAKLPPPRQPGILQSIGYKEFIPFILHKRHTLGATAVPSSSPHPGESRRSCRTACNFGCPAGTPCPPTLASATECLVRRSRQYARKQRRWIVNKFLLRQQRLPVFLLDTSDGSDDLMWQEKIRGPALQIVQDFLEGKPFTEANPFAAAAHLTSEQKRRRQMFREIELEVSGSGVGWDPWVDGGLNRHYTCTTCNRTCQGLNDWQDHLRSKAHRANQRRAAGGSIGRHRETPPRAVSAEREEKVAFPDR